MLMIFENGEFGKIRTLEVAGKPYFVAKDIATALGYTNPNKAVRDHCKGVNETFLPSKGGNQKTKIIPEGDMYRLIIHSKLPNAEKFESWVFDEVLPQIRKTGGYIPIDEEDEKLIGTLFLAGQHREVVMLTEDGLYEVLMQSRKPIAKQFNM